MLLFVTHTACKVQKQVDITQACSLDSDYFHLVDSEERITITESCYKMHHCYSYIASAHTHTAFLSGAITWLHTCNGTFDQVAISSSAYVMVLKLL